MGLLELFNQWIVERGSAAVQEKHIALFKDQLAAANKKISLLESENAVLKSEVNKFKSESVNLRIANNELADKIKEYENPSSKDVLDETKTKILVFLSKQQAGVMIAQIVHSVNLAQQATIFHVTELVNMHKVQQTQSLMGMPSLYSLSHEGRRYLNERNLL